MLSYRTSLVKCHALKDKDVARFTELNVADRKEIRLMKGFAFREKFPEFNHFRFREEFVDEFLKIDETFKLPLDAQSRILLREKVYPHLTRSENDEFTEALLQFLRNRGAF